MSTSTSRFRLKSDPVAPDPRQLMYAKLLHPRFFRNFLQDYFARLPNLRLTEYTPVAMRVYGDFATQAGTYTFAWVGTEGQAKEKRARFSFTMRRDSASPTAWTIVEHHSSAMPTSPTGLKHATNF